MGYSGIPEKNQTYAFSSKHIAFTHEWKFCKIVTLLKPESQKPRPIPWNSTFFLEHWTPSGNSAYSLIVFFNTPWNFMSSKYLVWIFSEIAQLTMHLANISLLQYQRFRFSKPNVVALVLTILQIFYRLTN